MKRFFSTIGCGVLFLIGAILTASFTGIALTGTSGIAIAIAILVVGLLVGLVVSRPRRGTICDWCRQPIAKADRRRFSAKDGGTTVYFCSLKHKQEFIHSRDDPGQRIHEIRGY
jgi:YHS domain-containing protein